MIKSYKSKAIIKILAAEGGGQITSLEREIWANYCKNFSEHQIELLVRFVPNQLVEE